MFFFLSKTLDLAFDPLWWCLGLWGLGALLLTRTARKRLGRGLLVAGVAVLLVASTGPVARGLGAALEADAPRSYRPDVTYDAVIVLGGAVDFAGIAPGEPTTFGGDVERLLVARELLQSGHARLGIVTGGSAWRGGPSDGALSVAELTSMGIAPDRLVAETTALNTHQNAAEVATLVRARGLQRLLVVTSAFHMQRAKGCFEAEGLAVDTLPVDYRVRDWRRGGWAFRAEHLEQTASALREYAGRLVYRVRGYSR
jgi:uncharacterized SAM-binding protein YcdF (DUF218 family)